jgi:L-asparaginase/beta-aspartyl-peptidase (threonine type)
LAEPTVVVHGGCGNLRGEGVRGERDYHAALSEAVMAASAALTAGAGALGAVQAAVARLEDAPMFNAGRGSVLTSAGTVEMDASIACGRTGRVGAVAAVTGVRHPVALARAVMESTPHVLMAGPGAEALAEERVAPEWLVTERQRRRLNSIDEGETDVTGTVGAVVLDGDGFLAAATSSGGVLGQLPGRVGDSPVIGAGTWADEAVAVSATGSGEAILRAGAAHEVAALMRHAGLDLAAACERVVAEVDGEAGLIAVDAAGGFAMPFDTDLMHRGWRVGDGEVQTAVLR